MIPRSGEAAVILLGDRFFYGFSKDGKVLTAWTLQGAKLFDAWHPDELNRTQDRIEKKRGDRGLPMKVSICWSEEVEFAEAVEAARCLEKCD